MTFKPANAIAYRTLKHITAGRGRNAQRHRSALGSQSRDASDGQWGRVSHFGESIEITAELYDKRMKRVNVGNIAIGGAGQKVAPAFPLGESGPMIGHVMKE